jgi:endonuclease G
MKKIFLIILFSSCLYAQNPYNWVHSVHTSLGVPFDQDTTDDYIIIRPQYVLSYNYIKGVPNWVAWQLNKEWYGDIPRYNGNFITDTTLPKGMYRVKHSDYTNSGYDRGHMVRSEERTRTFEDNISTFILTNIMPQTPDLNRGVWLDFEYYCEDLCKEFDKDLYIYAGGVFHHDSTIKGEGKVAVPDSCFKIVLICNRGSVIPIDTIAVMMPNIEGVRTDKWEKYKSTLKNIEQSTGYKFLSNITSIKENNEIYDNHYDNHHYIYDIEGKSWDANMPIKPKLYFQWNGKRWEKKIRPIKSN